MKRVFLLTIISFWAITIFAQIAPDWVHIQTPSAENNTYFYQVIAVDNASSLAQAQEIASSKATKYGIEAKKNWVDVNTLKSNEGEMRVAINLACPVYEEVINGKTTYYFLYQISRGVDVPRFETCRVCNSRDIQKGVITEDKMSRNQAIKYIQTRAIPASVFCPGAGQMVKDQYLKGGLILGGEVIGIGGIITAFSMKSSYESLIVQDPRHATIYADYADTWQNVGFGFIGLAAAIYVYNIIDVLVVRPNDSAIDKVMESLAFAPFYSPNDGSLGLAMQIKF